MSSEPLSDESVTNIANHQVIVFEDGRCGCEVEIIHLRYGQTEIN
jgi:hypothetical protein